MTNKLQYYDALMIFKIGTVIFLILFYINYLILFYKVARTQV